VRAERRRALYLDRLVVAALRPSRVRAGRATRSRLRPRAGINRSRRQPGARACCASARELAPERRLCDAASGARVPTRQDAARMINRSPRLASTQWSITQ
jgi:hypothetical protein